jgi:hypothetical protein
MPHNEYQRHFGKPRIQPSQKQIGPDALHQAVLREEVIDLPIDPPVSDVTSEDPSAIRQQLPILFTWPHVLEVVKLPKRLDLPGMKWFKQDPAGDLRGNEICHPRSTASACASNHDTSSRIPVGISIQSAADSADDTFARFTVAPCDVLPSGNQIHPVAPAFRCSSAAPPDHPESHHLNQRENSPASQSDGQNRGKL